MPVSSSKQEDSDSRLMNMAKEIQASSVSKAEDKMLDPATAYKRKLFYRRLKASLLGLTALTLLLAGCLLGFVLPASLEVPGQERANSTNRNEGLVALGGGNNSLPVNSTVVATPLPEAMIQQHTTKTSVEQPQAQVTKGRPTKFWALNWHDSIQKQNKQNMIVTSTMPTIPTTTNTYKRWLMHWKEHVENALQKNKQRNGTNESSVSGEGKRPQQPRNFATFTIPTTTAQPVTASTPNSTSAPNNQTTRANVRRVTSYPKSNITTTPPSVVTRHV